MDFQQYFQSYHEYFWQWEDAQTVIAIPGDQTIAFTEQVLEMLEVLSLEGLPRFGPLLLAIAATNNSDTILDSLKLVFAKHLNFEDEMSDGFAFLNLLKSLPQEYRTGHKRNVLFQTIFENSHNRLSIKNSVPLVKEFKKAYKLPGFRLRHPLGQGFAHSEFKIIALLHKRFKTIADIEKAMLGFSPKAFELELEDFESESDEGEIDLVTQLLQNPQTNKVGALIKRIWSTVNIPMHHRVSSGQPFGGVADITNKGSFDKLLTSEFANEDITFLSRLANNEALFFNREAPPTKNNQTRVIIVDVSLKNWGNVHVISMAMLLAICNNPKSEHDHICFGVGNKHYSFETDYILGILDAMNVLNTSMSAAAGLEALFKRIEVEDKEVFFISLKETAEDAEVKEFLSAHNYPIDYWIHPSTDGGIEVYKKYRTGKKLHQSLILPVEQLWTEHENVKRKKSRSPIKNNRNKGQFPLLTPSPGNCDVAMYLDGEIYKINKDANLYKKVGRRGDTNVSRHLKGYQFVTGDLPDTASIYNVGRNSKGELILFSYMPLVQKIELFNIDLNSKIEITFKSFPKYDKPICVYFNFSFIMILGRKYRRITMDGKILDVTYQQEQIQTHRLKMLEEQSAMTKELNNESIVIYKNIEKVSFSYVAYQFHFIIGAHYLFLNDQGDLKLKSKRPPIGKIKKIAATKDSINDTYSFEDGSTVENTRSGILVLKSSDPDIPTIYLASTVGPKLGMATEEVFAGNDYFYRPSSTLMKITRPHHEAGKYTGPLIRFYEHTLNKSNEIEMEGGPTNISNKTYYGLERINTAEFYQKYIRKFIETIKKHHVT